MVNYDYLFFLLKADKHLSKNNDIMKVTDFFTLDPLLNVLLTFHIKKNRLGKYIHSYNLTNIMIPTTPLVYGLPKIHKPHIKKLSHWLPMDYLLQ